MSVIAINQETLNSTHAACSNRRTVKNIIIIIILPLPLKKIIIFDPWSVPPLKVHFVNLPVKHQ